MRLSDSRPVGRCYWRSVEKQVPCLGKDVGGFCHLRSDLHPKTCISREKQPLLAI